mgnify:CR=1 FL=1
MGKRSFFPRLALVNMVRNSRYYGPYLLSCGALAAMYYILRFLTWNEVIQTVRGAAYLQVMMSIGCFVVARRGYGGGGPRRNWDSTTFWAWKSATSPPCAFGRRCCAPPS